jgi:hypothetical protein
MLASLRMEFIVPGVKYFFLCVIKFGLENRMGVGLRKNIHNLKLGGNVWH